MNQILLGLAASISIARQLPYLATSTYPLGSGAAWYYPAGSFLEAAGTKKAASARKMRGGDR